MAQIETYLTPDGRRAERRTDVVEGENGEKKLVHEVFEEEKQPKNLKKRVVEIVKPVIVEREIQEIEGDQVVKTERESIHPDVKMELREVTRFATKEQPQAEEQLTKQDVQDVVNEAVKDAIEEQAKMLLKTVEKASEKNSQSPRPTVSQYQALVGENVAESNKVNVWNALGVLVILAQIAAIGYFMLF